FFSDFLRPWKSLNFQACLYDSAHLFTSEGESLIGQILICLIVLFYFRMEKCRKVRTAVNVNKICKFCFDSFAPCVALCQHLCKTHNCICEEHVAYTTIIFNIIRLDGDISHTQLLELRDILRYLTEPTDTTCLALGAPISIRCACVLIRSPEFATITMCRLLLLFIGIQ
ncbi:hypothetical protein Tsp_14106, partial [Trichinella spiralis]|uniref:hypothetical protein n=1 Tax=Trichinella spiralis TaxID=6334 RepID=UPI0001EFE426